jgi:hypothetical protein
MSAAGEKQPPIWRLSIGKRNLNRLEHVTPRRDTASGE